MQTNYSDKMIRLLKNPVSEIIRKLSFAGMIFFILLSVVTLGLSISENNKLKNNPDEFDPVNDTKYSTLTPEYLSESFATGYGGMISYCIAVTADNCYYIVGIDTDKLDEYKGFIEYSNDKTLSKPHEIVFTGVPQKPFPDLKKYALKNFNTILDDKFKSPDSSNSFFEKYYLDTTMTPVPDYTASLILLFFSAFSGFVYNRFCLSRKKYQAIHNDTIELAGESVLFSIDADLSAPSTVHLTERNGCNVYVTDTHVVSKVDALKIIPLADISNLFFLLHANPKKQMQTVVVVTKDGSAHEILVLSTRDANAYNRVEITKVLTERILDLQLTKPEVINELPVEENTCLESAFLFILGIIGAVIGALLGGLYWFALKKIEFISGIAGIAILFLAIKGFTIATGRPVDRKTTLIAFFISVIMIPFAEFSSQALIIMNSLSLSNFISFFGKLPEIMTALDFWSVFSNNLILGYVLSIIYVKIIFRSL